ncbi:MAG TPA: SPOR domain-containing protein, partial [Micropepsaceae bacterium]|nr:SPOR domain-containing protein [Micropepsaceae bacterium]
KLAMGPGAAIPVETAIKALTVLSANDVAVVIAEALSGGSEEAFGAMMTEKAHQLGMTRTNFHNASGLPDLQQLTTARDMALLARHLAYDFPQYYHYFSAPGFTYNGRSYATHDNLLAAFGGTDGIKTGYTRLSGFNLVTSAVRNSKHLIGVVMGGPTAAVRDREMMRLLSSAFDLAKDYPTLLADVDVPWKGGRGPAGDMFKTAPEDESSVLAAAFEPNRSKKTKFQLPAPVLVADAKDPAVSRASLGPGIVPILKPAMASDSQIAAATPAITHDANVIEPLQHDPAKMPALRLGPAIALHLDTSPVTVAQGDGGDVTASAAVSAPAAPVAIPMPTVAVPAISAPASMMGNPVLASSDTVKHWAIQVGAFASEALARAKLASFVRRGIDVVGQAQKLVVPFAVADGHVLYRARLGMFAESEARSICKRMVQRGEACMAAPADAG